MRRYPDLVTARALRLALDPGNDPERSARELLAYVEGRTWALEVVLVRLRRGLAERWSPVGARAAASVEAALALVATPAA